MFSRQTEQISANIASDKTGMSSKLLWVYVIWSLVWYDPDWFLAKLGAGQAVVKLYAAMFVPILIWLFFNVRKEAMFWPVLVTLAVHVVWWPFAENRGVALYALQNNFQYVVLLVFAFSIIENPAEVIPLLKLFLFMFLWFGVQGLRTGGVEWHNSLSNEDSYGPLMSMGLGYVYYLGINSPSLKYRLWGLGISALCVLGTIASFARGAMISLCALVIVMGLRTSRKLLFIGMGSIGAVFALIVITLLFPNGEFWDEMRTITEEGNEKGTGLQRWVLWNIAWELFLHSPFFGVGPLNFGWEAAVYYESIGRTNIGSTFDDPSKLALMWLHNDYMTVLSEQGVIGFIAFVAAILYCFMNNRLLMSDEAQLVWGKDAGEFLDARSLGLGLEAGMMAYLFNAFFYNQYYVPWFWSFILLSVLCGNVTRRGIKELEARTVPKVGRWK